MLIVKDAKFKIRKLKVTPNVNRKREILQQTNLVIYNYWTELLESTRSLG